jgi:hypothetical protein
MTFHSDYKWRASCSCNGVVLKTIYREWSSGCEVPRTNRFRECKFYNLGYTQHLHITRCLSYYDVTDPKQYNLFRIILIIFINLSNISKKYLCVIFNSQFSHFWNLFNRNCPSFINYIFKIEYVTKFDEILILQRYFILFRVYIYFFFDAPEQNPWVFQIFDISTKWKRFDSIPCLSP